MRLLKFTDRKDEEAPVNLEILQPAELQRRIPLDGSEFCIGRDAACTLRFDFPDVSRVHARIYRQGRHWLVEDCGSRNGVWVNGGRIGRKQLADGDLVKVGTTLIRFTGEHAPCPRRTWRTSSSSWKSARRSAPVLFRKKSWSAS